MKTKDKSLKFFVNGQKWVPSECHVIFVRQKILNNILKLSKLVGLILGNVGFWRPIWAEGRFDLPKKSEQPQNGVKTTATDIQEFTDTMRIRYNSVFVKKSRKCARGGTMCPPPPFLGLSNAYYSWRFYL